MTINAVYFVNLVDYLIRRDLDGVKKWRRTYNNTFESLAAEYPDRAHKAATIIFIKSANGEPGICFNLDFTADDGGRRAAGLDRGGDQ